MTEREKRSEDRRATLGRRAMWVGLGAAALVAVVMAAAVLPNATALAHGGFGRGGHGHDGRWGEGDRAAHAEMAAEWIIRWVDGTPEQQEQVAAIVAATAEELEGIRERHRAQHEAFTAEMTRPEIDRAALDSLRRESVGMLDEASQLLAAGLADAAEVLSPEQRVELMELAQKFHHR